MQFVVYVFSAFTFSFCYCFYEGFIHKIILVIWFLPFICISYPLKVFKFDTGILRDSCAVPLLKTLSILPQSIPFYVWFCSSCLLAIIFRFEHLLQWFTERQQKCCWILLFHWIQLCLLLTLSRSVFFELPVLNLLVLYLICSLSAEVALICISRIRFKFSFFCLERINIWFKDSISIAQFPLWFA